MKIADIISALEMLAPPVLQEPYDNAGLLTGNSNQLCTGVLCALDSTEQVVDEAIAKNCNLIVAHHPIIFKGLKAITGKNYIERVIIKAIKNDIAIYAIHTNLDNVIWGVNGKIADKLKLVNREVLAPKGDTLRRLYTFVPKAYADKVRQAIFDAGGGNIGNYSECSFNTEGVGTFTPGNNTKSFVGEQGEAHKEDEIKLEVIYPYWLEKPIITAMKKAHPYEEVAYDCISLVNTNQETGSGMIGELSKPISETDFLSELKTVFGAKMIRHTAFLNKPIRRVAVCGGAGSFLIFNSLGNKADAFVTADMKYHEFFDADGEILIADIGHYESEQFTVELLQEVLQRKFPTFAVLKTTVKTNPVHYC